MTRPHHHGGRPNQNNNQKSWPKKKRQDETLHRADDQIAPSGVSSSVGHLRQWALATANMPQQGHRKNETAIIERIQQRYEDPNPSQRDASTLQSWHHAPPDNHGSCEHSGEAFNTHLSTPSIPVKRRRSASQSPSRSISHKGLGAVGHVPSAKRRRSRSPSLPLFSQLASTKQEHRARRIIAGETEDEDDYAQSSEWSFPSSEHGPDDVD